jgi:polysaccharide deacetylase 2 family uncharacterized protein YibQ
MTDSRDEPALDDLTTPLGQMPRKPRRPLVPVLVLRILAGALGGFAAIFLGWALFANAPFGGEPMAAVRLESRVETRAERAAPAPKPIDDKARGPAATERPNRYDGPDLNAGQPPAAGPASNTITIIDGTSGKRQEIQLPTRVPNTVPDRSSQGADQRFAEASAHGSIPRIAPDGTRPAEAFAQPVKPLPGRPAAPRIAVIVAGLGISATGTGEALAKLPGPVTLAFAPYGENLDRLAARARDGGHELLLQVPMEPFDYPDNDPGPQVLLTSLDAPQNVDRLHWLMSRLTGYVGIANYMGARFTTSEQALAPILRETAMRGLIYVEDGSAPRSVAGEIAGANNLPFAKADVTIDAVPSAAEIDRALARLERTARDRGIAVGVANGLPASIDRIAAWAKGLDNRGLLLVPISAAAKGAKSS